MNVVDILHRGLVGRVARLAPADRRTLAQTVREALGRLSERRPILSIEAFEKSRLNSMKAMEGEV